MRTFKYILPKDMAIEYRIVVAGTDIIFQYFYKIELKGIFNLNKFD